MDFNTASMMDAMRYVRGKADVIVFGESVLQGFDSLCWDYEQDRHTAVSLTDAPIRKMREAAGENGLAVSFGLIERDEDALYSSQIFIGAADCAAGAGAYFKSGEIVAEHPCGTPGVLIVDM